MNWIKTKEDTVSIFEQTTQPLPVVASGFIILEMPLEQWVLVGTAVLIVLNIALRLPQVWKAYKKKDDDEQE